MSQHTWPQRKIKAAKDFVAITLAEGTFIAGMGVAQVPNTLKEVFISVARGPSTLNIVANGMAVGVDVVVVAGGAIMVYKAYGYLKELRRVTGLGGATIRT